MCQLGEAWGDTNCSRKIIGARYYAAGLDKANLKLNYMSARDMNGHGTHTASTAAGSVVEGVSLHGLGEGVARGGAPRARLAVYKVGWEEENGVYLATAAVLAAMDDAIHDGVDILSLSIVADDDSFGALHAVQNGITVVYAGGNGGPRSQVLFNTAPWVITVAASKIDRSFPTTITLGNKQTLIVYTRRTLFFWNAERHLLGFYSTNVKLSIIFAGSITILHVEERIQQQIPYTCKRWQVCLSAVQFLN